MKHIIENWRTSLGGLIMAVLLAIQPLVMNDEPIDFQKDWFKLLLASLIAIFGFILKDPKNKSESNGESDTTSREV